MSTAQIIGMEKLNSRIRTAWCRSQLLHLLAGVFAFVCWAVPLFLLGMFIDWMTYMPAPGRIAVLVVLLCVAFYRAWRRGWRHLRAFDAVATALQLESQHGEMNSLLVSAVQLRGENQHASGSSALRDRTCQLAENAALGLSVSQTVPFTPLRRPTLTVALFVAVVMIFFTVNRPFLMAGVTRFFVPWLNVEYPTYTQISLSQNSLVIQEGESASIAAQIGGITPNQATIYVRTGEGRAREIDLEVVDGVCTYTIASASRDFSYRITAGDDRTGWHEARVVPAPRIEEVAVGLKYPPYLGREQESIEALTLTVPEGTGVDWKVVLDRPVRSAQFFRDGESPVDLDVGSDDRTLAFTADVSASKGYHFRWVDKDHEFEFSSPRYFLQVSSDQAPRVELTSPVANLVAMLGRPLDLAVRVQDDHGLGSTTVAYRVNQRDEVPIKLDAPLEIGQGEQVVDWDYRKSVPDLQIGDTVSLVLEVSDRYPEPLGPHVVRSDTRRITFLSKDKYLAQIEKQKDRLLSRVQAIYRQQRSAYEVVRSLEPAAQGYIQACQLEAIRQEMVRDQLKQIANQLQTLLDDLAANDVSDTAEGESLEAVRLALIVIAEKHVAQAAVRLREQSGDAASGKASGPQQASNAVNTAARDLGALVLLRGIDAAQEVYARESRMLAQVQASLRWQAMTLQSTQEMQSLLQRQTDVGLWTTKLIQDLQSGMRFQQRPLAVLRLIRSVKGLRDAMTVERMNKARTLISSGEPEQAADIQAELVRTLLDAEFSVRLSGAYSTLLETRDLIESLGAVQRQLQIENADMTKAEFKSQRQSIVQVQQSLRNQLVTMMLPTVPAPRAGMFDEQMPQVPPVDALLRKANNAMAAALVELKNGDKDGVVMQQTLVEQTLAELLLVVERWSVEMGLRTQGLGTLVAASSARMSSIEEYEARVIGFLEKTDLASADQKPVDGIADSQQNLTDELAGFVVSLKKPNESEPDPDLPPLLNQLEKAAGLLQQSVQSLRESDADAAIACQEESADALAEAYAIVVAQNDRLTLLQDLLLFQRSVGFANGYMEDIVAEQRELLALTESAEPEAMKPVLPQFGNMLRCLEGVSPLLDMVAARLDVGTPLAFAKTDFEDAIAALEIGDKFDAVDAQDVAAESLADVQVLVQDIQSQTGYVAEIVAFLHQSVSDTAMWQYRQDELRKRIASAKSDGLPRILKAQSGLLVEAHASANQLLAATGMPSFTEAADLMQEVVTGLIAGDAVAAAEAMELVSAVYSENAESLLSVITMLHGLPSIEIVADSDPALVRLIDVLALASDHKHLFRRTQSADAATMENLAKQQGELAERLSRIAEDGEPHPMLSEAGRRSSEAVKVFKVSELAELRGHLKIADEKLRHFIVDQALILETAAPIAASSEGDGDSSEGSDSESAFAAGFISDFVSGEAARDKSTEWKVLGDRNRAALNQNFARELPLEYRALLKNYYERVAK